MEEVTEKRATTSNRVFFLAQAAFIVMVATLLSRITGYVREMVMAFYFGGARVAVDAYRAGFILPNLFRMLLADAAVGSAFIPVFTSYLAKGKEDEAWKVGSSVINIAALILLTITVVGVIFAPQLLLILVPGFVKRPEAFKLAILLTRIMFPSIVFLSLAGIVMGILHSYDHFTAPAIAPLLFNVVVIGMVVFLASRMDIVSLALGVTLGSIVQFLYQLPYVRRVVKKKLYSFSFDWRHPAVKKVGALLVPVMISLAATDLNTMVDTRFASTLFTGSVGTLGYAVRLYVLPLGLFAFAISAVLFPTFSRQIARDEMDEFRSSFSLGTRMMFYVLVPSAVGLMVLSFPIVRFLFQHGEFGPKSTILTSSALVYYSLGLWAYGELQLVNRVFYSLKDTLTPMIVAIASIVVNYFGDWALMRYLPVLVNSLGFPETRNLGVYWLGLPHGGIALSTTLVSIFSFLVLLLLIKRRLGRIDGKRITLSFVKIVIASIALGFAAYYSWLFLDSLLGKKLLFQAISLFGGIGVGILVYIFVSFVLRIEEAKTVWKLLLARIFKGKATL